VLVVFLFAIATIRARSAPCGTPFGAPGISGSTLTLAEGDGDRDRAREARDLVSDAAR